jgi:formylmethanofuran dehydrogenase subunit C
MQNRGLPQPALVKGKTVTVEGYASKTHENEMRIERITVDGKVVELR